MLTETALQEYLDEIRAEVCTRCVERPAGGPPCSPLGKPCGIELHLPELIKAVQDVRSDLIDPYLDHNRARICEKCTYLHDCNWCPCPMDTLAVLLVEAIETVDERRALPDRGKQLLAGLPGTGIDRPDMKEIAYLFEEAAGTWTGCDWPTMFGASELNLQGCTAAEAEARAVEATGRDSTRADWAAAADWLHEVERRAENAESEATLAVAAANESDWSEAVTHVGRAWSLEFSTGRPFRHFPATWARLHKAIRANSKSQNWSARLSLDGIRRF